MALDPKIKAVGFDMDGTFMDTRVDYDKLARVVIDAYSRFGVPPEVFREDGYKLTMDACDRWIREHGLWDRKPEIDAEIQANATLVEMENASVAKVFDGAEELVRKLRSEGYKVGILTRGGRAYAESIMKKAGVLDLFDALIARDDYPEAEAKPSAKAMEHFAEKLGVKCDEILYLGDGLVDYLTCANSGARFIGVCTGHDNRSRAAWVSKVGEDVETLPSAADLIRSLRSEELVAGKVPACYVAPVAEPFGLPKLRGRVLPEHHRIHGADAFSLQDPL